jgi:hypothetical protein
MIHFYVAGGWPMLPVSVFGFFLVAVSVLYALRPSARSARLAVTLGIATWAAGLLGTATGICLSARYIGHVVVGKQLEIFALGIEESLHNVVLALVLVVIACAIFAVGAARGKARAAA